MRKIKMLNRVSIDGYFASLNDATFGMDWFVHDPEVDKAVHESGGRMDTLLLGEITYMGFERSWVPILNDPNAPEQMKAVAEELTQMTKIVFSKNLKEAKWENTKIFDGNLVDKVRKLKEETGSDILVMGSGTIVQQLAEEELIDEYMFIVTPVVASEGKRLFQHVKRFGLRLLDTKAFKSGNVVLHYELIKL
ncbi:dihydrofolate reductase [Paenibacillus mesophilus]|uniref:dihydrofolate reductase family protein n=1 Tax=Paenibacillus mesophilus TaxID=2582849 RepID=UPI00110F01BC|nr:dihydrofolate reductase family protein [Paenibacillus mesophilus]TMV51941.1 dihydrofolate reductase [Paenibacillus mesophilus]